MISLTLKENQRGKSVCVSLIADITLSHTLSPLVLHNKSVSSDLSHVQGDAMSEFSKDPADNSTNYCSLQNLMDGTYSLCLAPGACR